MKKIFLLYYLVLSPLLFSQNAAQFAMHDENIGGVGKSEIYEAYSVKKNIIVLDRDFDRTSHNNLLESINTRQQYNSEFSSFQLIEQLEELDKRTPLDVVHNPTLERFIRSFLNNRRSSLENLMGRSAYYFPMMEESLDKYDLPLEIKYLAIVESALKPNAISTSGAKGLWQFMLSTGKEYDLAVDSYVDERYDPLRSTEAACRYLSDLYDMFQDWDLALAAYNSGPGNVRKAIRRAKGNTNYWEIRRFLPAETSSYVPAFYATYYIFEYAKQHELVPTKTMLTYFEVDTVQIRSAVSFDRIQENIGVSLDLLRALNPQYKKDFIPLSKRKTSLLTLPINYVEKFIEEEDVIYKINSANDINEDSFSLKLTKYNSHLVIKGDNLRSIALQYNISIHQLKKWNGLETDYLIEGQHLVVTNKKHNQLKGQLIETSNDNNAITNPFSPKVSPNFPSEPSLSKEVSSNNNYLIYEVKDGDTLFNISRKFQGISIDQLISWNDLIEVKYLKPGTKLKIFKS